MNKPVVLATAFEHPDAVPGPLPAEAAARLLSAVGDIALVLSAKGEILDVAISQSDLIEHGFGDWAGRGWIDTVTVESRPKVAEMLVAAAAGEPARWRQVNHPAPGGDVPIRYLVTGMGDDGRLAAVGRDLRETGALQQRLLQTQQALERDYLRLRQAEARYRLLFDLGAEAVLIVDAETRRIREANPAAHRLLDAPDGALVGLPVGRVVALDGRDALVAHLGAAEAADSLPPAVLPLAERRGDVRVWAQLFRHDRTPLLIVRMEPVDETVARRPDAALVDMVERMPDAFVLADAELKVLTGNSAFLELTGLPSLDRAVGMRLANWLGRPGIDLDLILAQLREHGTVRSVATIVRPNTGGREEVEVSGVVAPTSEGDRYGFTIRHVGRRLRAGPATADAPRSVAQLTELVGRMSLKEIVRESTDVIERLCIEAALTYTADNRASAAEILGLSRQSLYSKLHRHGLGNLDVGED